MTIQVVSRRPIVPSELSHLIMSDFVRVIDEKSLFEGRQHSTTIETQSPQYVRACLARLLRDGVVIWYT